MSSQSQPTSTEQPEILARGPWALEQVKTRWREEHFEPSEEHARAAAAAIAELQPLRWGLRLVPGDASESVAAMCVTRSADGRWLAGRRAQWVASWAGRWALGAGGAVDAGENPAHTLGRELREEWSVDAERITVEALVCLPHQLVLLVGLAWLSEGAQVVPDAEHDAFAWWPPEVDRWPSEADEPLRQTAIMLAAS